MGKFSESYYFDRLEEQGRLHYLKRASVLLGRFSDFDISTSGDLLDIGCALGEFMKLAKSKGFNVSGSEVSEFAASEATQKLPDSNIFTQDIQKEQLPIPDNSFDLITMFDVIEHMSRPFDALLEANRLLRPGARIVVVTSNANSLTRFLKGSNWVGTADTTHTYLFTAFTLGFLLERTGFDRIKTKTYMISTSSGNLLTGLANEIFDVTKSGGQLWAVAEKPC